MRGCNMNYFEVVSVPWTRQSRQIQQMFWMFQSMPQKVIFSLPSPPIPFLVHSNIPREIHKNVWIKAWTQSPAPPHWVHPSVTLPAASVEGSLEFTDSSEKQTGLPTLPICLSVLTKPWCKLGNRILWKGLQGRLCTQSQCVNIHSEALPEMMKPLSWD